LLEIEDDTKEEVIIEDDIEEIQIEVVLLTEDDIEEEMTIEVEIEEIVEVVQIEVLLESQDINIKS